MTESEIRYAFVSIDETTPIWVAIKQLISEQLTQAHNDLYNPALANDHGSLAFAAGEANALASILAGLEAQFDATHSSLNDTNLV